MASGINHDKATKIGSLVFGLLIGSLWGRKYGLTGMSAFFIGGFFLSPDLDTTSIPSKRWGLLKSIWLPYKKLIKHRSIFSHGPLIGTSIRLIYLGTILYFFLIFLKAIDIINISISFKLIIDIIKNNPKYIISILIGIEMSAWLHLIQDGDPLPLEWKRNQRK